MRKVLRKARGILRRGRKAVGAALGGATGGAVAGVLGVLGVSVDPELAGALAIVLATVGTWLAPKNLDG